MEKPKGTFMTNPILNWSLPSSFPGDPYVQGASEQKPKSIQAEGPPHPGVLQALTAGQSEHVDILTIPLGYTPPSMDPCL